MGRKRWRITRPTTGPGALAEKLSRRVRRHGAIFAKPDKWLYSCLVTSYLSSYWVPVDGLEFSRHQIYFQNRNQNLCKRTKSLLSRYNCLGEVQKLRQAFCLYQRVCCSNRELRGPGIHYERRLAGALASLQIVLMSRFCIFFQNKTVNYHMQARGASRVKYRLRVCPGGTNLLSGKNKLAEG